MRVLVACSLGGAGHLSPLLPFLAASKRREDDTVVVGPPALREMVEAAGHLFWAGGEPPEDQVAPIRERLLDAQADKAAVLANRELFGRLATGAMLPGMERAVAEWRPQLVVREPCEYASAVVAGREGLPMVGVAISLAEAEAGSIHVAAPALEAHRLGLVSELLASPYLTRFPESLDPSPFPRTVRFSEPAPGGPLPDWWHGSPAPLVYMSFGTVLGSMSIALDVYRVALDAAAELPARVLLSVGRRVDRSLLGPVPSDVHVEAWVDQACIVDHAAVVVCHGGSGTAFGALAGGVPVVVVPLFADQFENGRRIADAGAGLVVETRRRGANGTDGPHGGEDVERIRDAVNAVLTRDSYQQHARRLGDEMAATPTVDDVLDQLLHSRPG